MHASEAHARGTREIVVVLSGALRMHLGTEKFDLSAGDSISFPADAAHAYENPGAAKARYHNVILYER
jgi:mannose-6-phosphate isomerase-like protein (cupin superfamily)